MAIVHSAGRTGDVRGTPTVLHGTIYKGANLRRKAVHVRDLPKQTHEMFARAIELAGAGSQARWLSTQIRLFIREQQERFGADLFAVLTADEQQVLNVIRDGAAELQQIAEETLLTEAKVMKILERLERRKRIEARKKGGKTDAARGAVVTLYFIAE